jgi:nucleolar pre-ribosomal-associated protein 1
LQKFALEQLMELSSHLYKIFFGDVTLIKENVALVNPFLQIMIATLKISQKRKIYQPHFTLSVEGLYQIYQAVNEYNYAGSCPFAEDALKAVLMGTPPVALFHMVFLSLSHSLSLSLCWCVCARLWVIWQ